MSMRIGNHEFNDVLYDEGADILYLSLDEPVPAMGERTPEGHILLLDDDTGELCGVTLVSPRFLRESQGRVAVTLPEGTAEIQADELDLAMGALA